ncbi:Uncharacterized protein DAT39_017055 [Clarias magur]|uniref:Secreted protein n=1 Tax=Clarias magur TaxID=1594786 RepID=A0A8J4WWF7_CLAMG|nr:Uncharacterized protein DAT39_017055 [Clarias magur]
MTDRSSETQQQRWHQRSRVVLFISFFHAALGTSPKERHWARYSNLLIHADKHHHNDVCQFPAPAGGLEEHQEAKLCASGSVMCMQAP